MYNIEDLKNLQDMLAEFEAIEKCEEKTNDLRGKIAVVQKNIKRPPSFYGEHETHHEEVVIKEQQQRMNKDRKKIPIPCCIIYSIIYIAVCAFLVYQNYFLKETSAALANAIYNIILLIAIWLFSIVVMIVDISDEADKEKKK